MVFFIALGLRFASKMKTRYWPVAVLLTPSFDFQKLLLGVLHPEPHDCMF